MAYRGQLAKEFVDMDIVREHIGSAAAYVADATARQFKEAVEAQMRYSPRLQFDSPLEVLFWIWWDAAIGEGPGSELFELRPQQEVIVGNNTYRVDFLIDPTLTQPANWMPIAVELDGHAFHERTREQVATRDSRDRALQAAGWRVFHFSFGEFTAKPLDCISEVFGFARSQWQNR